MLIFFLSNLINVVFFNENTCSCFYDENNVHTASLKFKDLSLIITILYAHEWHY